MEANSEAIEIVSTSGSPRGSAEFKTVLAEIWTGRGVDQGLVVLIEADGDDWSFFSRIDGEGNWGKNCHHYVLLTGFEAFL
jgi:hypothetical protein